MKNSRYSHPPKAILQIVLLIAIVSLNMGVIGTSTVYAAAPPSNDNWGPLTAVDASTVPFTQTISIAAATVETNEPRVNVACDGKLLETGNNTVWYKYTSGSTRYVSFDTVGSDYDTYIAVWTGNAINALALVGCDDDNDIGYTSQFAFNAQAGITYYIQVAKFKCYQTGCSPEPACPTDTACSLTFNVKYQTFTDVPPTHPYFQEIEALYGAGLTGGCSTTPLNFCPSASMSRAQTAVFMLRGNFGSGYAPVTPTHIFSDSWKNAPWGEGWAESMYLEGLTGGCGSSPLKFCPDDILTNVQLAVFGMRLKNGISYTPPAATGTVFADLTDVNFWGTAWAEQAYAAGLIPACGTSGGKPMFCPDSLVNRGFGAYVIVKAKNLIP